jgi:prevent-host-death family protein
MQPIGSSAGVISSVIECVVKQAEGYGRPRILFSISTTKLRDCLSLTINQAGFGSDPILLTRRGRSVAAIISIADLEFLQRLKRRRKAARRKELPCDQSQIGTAIAQRLRSELFYG